MTDQRLPLAAGSQVWRALRGYLRRSRALTIVTVLLAAAASLSGLVAPWAIGILVDKVLDGGSRVEVLTIAAWVAGAGVLSAVLTAISSALVARIGQQILARLREDVLSAALRLPYGRLEEAGRGDLLSRVGDDAGIVSSLVAGILAPWISAVLAVTLTVAGLFALNPFLALAGLCAIPVYVLALRWYLPRAAPRYSRERAAFGDRAEALVASLEGVQTLHAYDAQEAQVKVIEASSDKARQLSKEVLWFSSRWGKWLNLAELVGLASIVTAGFFLAFYNVLTVGAVTAAALYFHRLFNPIGLIIFTFDDVQSAAASLQRMVGVLEVPVPDEAAAQRPTEGRVSARSITHAYGEHEVLHDVHVEVAAGEQIALVGSSGAGKSTLAVILAGLLEPTSGRVELGGLPVSEAALLSPRPIVLVTQESHVFAGELVDDLRLANAGASEAAVLAALELVGADEWVNRLPGGIHTVIGELGQQLSPDQVAQLSLARAVLANPQVIVLDEATAEAGSQNARLLEDAASAVLEGRTGVVVAHRLRQAQHSDRILVMADGRVIEEGPHEELLGMQGTYARLWAAYTG